jgi:Na+-driven multidrug efflux pump
MFCFHGNPGRAKYIAEALGKGEEEQVPRLIWATVTVQVALGMVGMLILVGITPLLIERTLNIPPALRAEAKTSFYLLALSIPAVFVSSSLTGVLAAAQRFDLVNAVGISLTDQNIES